jgi:ATP-dependent Clp protease protease subunit
MSGQEREHLANKLGSESVSQLIVPGDYPSAGDSFGPSTVRAAASPGMGYDDHIYNRLLKDRILFLGSEVRDDNANVICAQLLLLAAEDPEKDIFLYINSPGGSVTAGMAIYDTMQYISCDVATLAMGLAASMGQFLLTAGAKGKRYATPHARIMMHQPLGGIGGSATDIRIQAEQILHIKRQMAELIAEQTGQSVETIEADSDRDRWFTAAQAEEYGIVDHVVRSARDVSGGGGTGA